MGRTAAVFRSEGGRWVLANPFYYLTNFRTVLTSLESRYWHLLTAAEREFVLQFALLPQASAALIVRMIMRRGSLFRLSRLVYAEIGDSSAAAAPLVDIGWLEEPLLDVIELHRLLTKIELVNHLALSSGLARLNKRDLLAALRERHPQPRSLQGWCRHLTDRVFRPLVKSMAELFRLMFFGNFLQDWATFVLSDLGINSFETVPVHSIPFRTRAHIDVFHRLYRCASALADGVDLTEVVAGMPPPISDSDWIEEHRQRLLFQIGTRYERSGDVPAALAVYSTCRYRGSRMRAVRSLERLRAWSAARELCLIASSNPENGAERQQVERVLPRLNRKIGIVQAPAADMATAASFDLLLERPPHRRRLEIHVRDRLARESESRCTVHYVENGLINSLFGLLCWDAIFAPIAGAFFHDFQNGPADLHSPYFYERRIDRFAKCLAQLETGRYKEVIRQRLIAKAGIQAPFVTWGLLKAPLLEYALHCFPALHLRLWFEWIVRDVVENRSGFPDLVQFWPDSGRYRLVEIKGPGDRLQDNQRRFLEYCSGHKMPVFICRAIWQDDEASRRDARTNPQQTSLPLGPRQARSIAKL